jgi:hypothetical protein
MQARGCGLVSSPTRASLAGLANEELVRSIKDIVGRAKSGDADSAYHGYRDLFASPAFAGYRVEDQRQALQLMVLMKGAPKPATPAMLEAHTAARGILTGLVSTHAEPSDHELLGICHVVLGDEASASSVFKAGLAIERVRDPSSKLCGTLMKRVSML